MRDVRDLHCECCDREHGGEDRQAEDGVVRVEAVGVDREALPGDEDGEEERREDCEAPERVVVDELVGELGDGDDEDDVEEELEPARVALAVVVERP